MVVAFQTSLYVLFKDKHFPKGAPYFAPNPGVPHRLFLMFLFLNIQGAKSSLSFLSTSGAAPEAAAAVAAAATAAAAQPGFTKPAVPAAPGSTGSFTRSNTPARAWTQAGRTHVSTRKHGPTPAPANEFRPSLDDDALHGPPHDAGPPSTYGLLFSRHAPVR